MKQWIPHLLLSIGILFLALSLAMQTTMMAVIIHALALLVIGLSLVLHITNITENNLK